tara:strand:+ start:37 stop:228 length:192 start_codon:yes stop_codon:yes gene_type:complete
MSKPTPQTPKDWEHLTGLYETAMLKDKKTIAELKGEVNKLRKKLKNSHRVPKSDIEEIQYQRR